MIHAEPEGEFEAYQAAKAEQQQNGAQEPAEDTQANTAMETRRES
jgi:hypothetical protein